MNIEQAAHVHAQGFLLPIEPRISLHTIGKTLLELARKDPNVAKKFETIKQKLGEGKPLIGKEHSAFFESAKSRQVVPNIPTAPEWLRPLIAVGYLRAKDAVASGKVGKLLTNPEESFDKVIKLLDKLEENFLGELLVETVRLVKEDREFAKKINDGATEFRALVNNLYGIKSPRDAAKATPLLQNNEGCSACRTDPSGATVCSPIPCWVVVVVIVVVVVAK